MGLLRPLGENEARPPVGVRTVSVIRPYVPPFHRNFHRIDGDDGKGLRKGVRRYG